MEAARLAVAGVLLALLSLAAAQTQQQQQQQQRSPVQQQQKSASQQQGPDLSLIPGAAKPTTAPEEWRFNPQAITRADLLPMKVPKGLTPFATLQFKVDTLEIRLEHLNQAAKENMVARRDAELAIDRAYYKMQLLFDQYLKLYDDVQKNGHTIDSQNELAQLGHGVLRAQDDHFHLTNDWLQDAARFASEAARIERARDIVRGEILRLQRGFTDFVKASGPTNEPSF